MSEREKMPDRRAGDTLEVDHFLPDGNLMPLVLMIGRYADGRIGEVFIEFEFPRQKTAQTALGHDVATLISIALQYGAPLQVLRDAMGRSPVNTMGNMVERPHTLIGTVLDALTATSKDTP